MHHRIDLKHMILGVLVASAGKANAKRMYTTAASKQPPSFGSSVVAMVVHILILGAGISGLASAIALKKYLPDPDAEVKITIIEIRNSPSTIGGAVNLTPKALRYLNHLGVLEVLNRNGAGAECKKIEIFDLYTGSKSAELDFCGADGNGIGAPGSAYFARRVMRAELQSAMLEVCDDLENVSVLLGKKTVSIEEKSDCVELCFESGDTMTADLVLGCDGIHSVLRSLLIDPDRQPSYTGVATSMATSRVRKANQLRWQTTGLVQSRKGSFMASHFNELRQEQYIAVVVETPEVANREGWKIRGSDQKAIKHEILQRFDSAAMPELRGLIEDAGDWTMYPVYQLPMGGKWMSSGARCIIIGDAAHAVSPNTVIRVPLLIHLDASARRIHWNLCRRRRYLQPNDDALPEPRTSHYSYGIRAIPKAENRC